MITVSTLAHNIEVGNHILMHDGIARRVVRIHYEENIIAFEMAFYEEKSRHFLFIEGRANVIEEW